MSLSEKLLELCGIKIWPPTHNVPRVEGPKPHFLSKSQWKAIEKWQKENDGDNVDVVTRKN